jgi:TRAP-type C4-dicarboxylate transport system permease small subunit
MTGWLSRGLGALDRLLSCALGAMLIIIFSLNLYQVGGRYLFGVGAVWIPDLTRLLFIWMVFLGTALMHQRKRHLVIDVLLLTLPGPGRRAIEALLGLGMLGLAGVMVVVGWRIMQIRMDIPYTGLEIPTGYAYLAVPVAAALIALTSLANLWEWMRAGKRRAVAGVP